ncbi:MAG: phosphate signaling complex protein PhoU [Promethearchaeota archaeon]|nr:MAG: phosphate signaling complex protein PhoU [Candidatus Lokiarchaeota archaeon]
MSKNELHREITHLKNDVLDMAKLALNMLENSITSLNTRDLELAKEVDHNKHKLREYDTHIEERAFKLIALHQPMAIDLRSLATILKIITYLYRLGRYGKDIAAVVELLTDKPPISEMLGITHMWEHVKSLIADAIESFDKSNITKLKDFEERDNEVDQMRWSIFRESVSYMMENPANITICAHIIMIARYLERCGDHACKIAEKVHYMVTGQHIEIS